MNRGGDRTIAGDAGRTDQNVEGRCSRTRPGVLFILPQEVLDRARVFAGEATTKLKRPVSLQMVLRALTDEGLKRDGDRAMLANIEGQVQAVRQIRSQAGRARGIRRPGVDRRVRGRRPQVGRT
jgi:hypothetical protein